MSKLISVILPVFNAEKYLERAIDSILSQSYSELELILVDDGSTDQSVRICIRYAEKDPRIKLIINSKNLGIAKSLNKGIKEAKGEYIARMDADDISVNDRLERQLEFLKHNSEVSVLGSSVEMIDAEGKPVKHFGQTYLNHNTLKFSSYLINPFFHGSVMLKSQVLRPNSYHTESSAEDFELWLRLCSKGFKFANLKESLYRYRINPTGYSKSKTAKQNEGHILASKQYVELLLNEKLDTNIMSILNCRPQSKPSINEVFKAIKLFKRIKAAVAPANENELRTFIRRQRLDIFIQSLKSGKNIITKFLLLLFTLLELLHFRSAQYFIQKIWSKRVY